MSIEKVYIDTKDVAAKLSFLVGKTILFRDGYKDETTAASVIAVKVENTPGENGRPQVTIYTTIGVLTVTKSTEFNNFMLLDGKSIGTYADEMGIYF